MRWVRAARIMSVMVVVCGCLRTALPPVEIQPRAAAQPMGWDRALAMASQQHPELLQARAASRAAAHAARAALGKYLPTIDAAAQRSRVRTTAGATNDAMSATVDMAQPLFTGFATTGEYLQAKRAWEAADFAYAETSAEVCFRLRTAFIELMRLTQILEVHQRIAERRRENADMIQLRYDAGREHKGSALRAQAIAAQAAFDVAQTRRQLEVQSIALGRELGGFFYLSLPITNMLSDFMPEEPLPRTDYAALAEHTPTVWRLLKTAAAREADIMVAKGELLPQVSLFAEYGVSGAKASDLDDSGRVGVRVSLPLFEGGRNLQGVLESDANYIAALEAARRARDAQIEALVAAWADVRDAWELVAIRQQFLDAARERSEIVRSQYTTGLANFQDFDIAEQDLADSEKAHVNSLSTVLERQATWDRTRGATLEEALSASQQHQRGSVAH